MTNPTRRGLAAPSYALHLLVLAAALGAAPAASAQGWGIVTPAILVPSDETITAEQVAQVEAGLKLVAAWYRQRLDRELNIASLAVVHGQKTSAEYREGAIWSEAPSEIASAVGHAPWSAGYIELVLGRGAEGWAGGSGTADRGRAAVGLESLIDTARCAGEWWCTPEVWVGTVIHELGHALTLPHSTGNSIMRSHVSYASKVLLDTPEFPERTTVRRSIFSRPATSPLSLRSVETGKCLDVGRAQWHVRAPYVFTCWGGRPQAFRIEPAGEGFLIRSDESGKCFDVGLASWRTRGPYFFSCYGGRPQQFRWWRGQVGVLESVERGGECLDLGLRDWNVASPYLYSCYGGSPQRFAVEAR
jgi:hypothetical protein